MTKENYVEITMTKEEAYLLNDLLISFRPGDLDPPEEKIRLRLKTLLDSAIASC